MVGMFVGKFLPPHKGHINAIKKAAKQCDKLFVVVGGDEKRNKEICDEANIPFISLETKTEWIKNELKGIENVEVISFNEEGIPTMPNGWKEWSEQLKALLNEKIDIIFGSERSYENEYKKYFSESKYVLQDEFREEINISSTKIRSDVNKYYDYICDSAKPFFKEYLLSQNKGWERGKD